MTVLVTGGVGYIGSHTVVELLQNGYRVIVMDNLRNSDLSVLDRIGQITGIRPGFICGDVADPALLRNVFSRNRIDAVIHFAGLKAVRESCEKPMLYYYQNLASAAALAMVMAEYGCRKLVFSSSATVYGMPEQVPVREDAPLHALSPYGNTKRIIEEIYQDLCRYDNDFRVILLRYFNPIGAHESGLIGEDPNGIPNNLMPNIVNAVLGRSSGLTVFGNDYPTPDGTGVRDYIHVTDLARGHVCALAHMDRPGARIYNLGTGHGLSVLELIRTFEQVNGVKVPYTIGPRRDGDAAEYYADASLAEKELGWKSELDAAEMCRSTWRYAQRASGLL